MNYSDRKIWCTDCRTWSRWRCSWWRHCATNRKVAVSNPDGFIGIFHRHNPSGCTMTLVLTQPLTEMSTRNIPWGVGKGKLGRCIGLTTLPPSYVLKSGCLSPLEPPGPVKACNGIALPTWLPNLDQWHFVRHKPTVEKPGIESEPPQWKASDCLSLFRTVIMNLYTGGKSNKRENSLVKCDWSSDI
jgi:hypothetical protein